MAIRKSAPTALPKKADDLIQLPQPLPLYEFIPLPDPPSDWMYLNIRYGGVHEDRTFKMNSLLVLAKHYFWGIHWADNQKTAKTIRKAHNIKTLTRALWKLFYYMQDIHRPKSLEELMNVDRDTGPRLLRYDLSPRPAPLSRWFPDQPNDRTILLPAYVRPKNAPLDLPDVILQQYLYSAVALNSPSVPQIAHQQPPTNEQLLSSFTFTAQPSLFPPTPPYVPALPELSSDDQQDLILQNNLLQFLQQYDESLPSEKYEPGPGPSPKRRRTLSPAAPSYLEPVKTPAQKKALRDPVYAAQRTTLEWDWTPPLEPIHFAPPVGEPELGPILPTGEPVYQDQVVAEAVEKALMQVVYNDLERDPTIPSRHEPAKYQTAHSFSDLLNMKIGTFSTIESVRLSPLTLEWDRTGALFPLRGRGPVWDANSCATDCVIVAGMLLDAGCTKMDRANNRSAQFTENEKSFIEVTNVPWDTFDDKMSKRVLLW